MFMTPALVYFAAAGVSLLVEGSTKLRRNVVAAAAALAVASLATGAFRAPAVAGTEVYTAALAALHEKPQRLLYAGGSNGTFIFRVREIAGAERPVVARASKLFYAHVVQEELGTAMDASADEVERRLENFAPDVVVVERESGNGAVPEGLRHFLELVDGPDFVRIGAIDGPGGKPGAFDLYRYVGPRRRADVPVPLPGVGMEFELSGAL